MTERITFTCGAPGTDFPGFEGWRIQAAIDTAASLGGGTVRLSAGTFHLADSVHLKTGVTLIGEGSDTVLLKDPMVESDTIHYLGYGHCEIMVAHPERFKIGMGVYITDKDAGGGFSATQSTICSIDGNTLGLMDPLECDIAGRRGGRCRTLFPLVKGSFQKHIAVKNLVLDGRGEENEKIDGCRGGCVFLIGCSYAAITGIECRNYSGDGISYQQCYDVAVENCHVHHMSVNGLHPGSGTIKSRIIACHVHHCGKDGMYYCLRTQYLLLKDCLIEDNHRFGINCGHHDDYTDIIGNTVRGNGWEGLFFRTDNIPYATGKYSTVAHNVFENNGYTEDELRISEIHAVPAMLGLRMYDNVIRNDGKIHILLDEPCSDTYIFRNTSQPTLKEGVEHQGPWYSAEDPGDNRTLADFPITEDTLRHLKHICR